MSKGRRSKNAEKQHLYRLRQKAGKKIYPIALDAHQLRWLYEKEYIDDADLADISLLADRIGDAMEQLMI